MVNETEYRTRIQEVLDRIERVFESIDPDIIECEQSLGSMTLTFGDGSRCILSAQPSVQQLWLALASRGTAYHFNYDLKNQHWIDDKGKGIELVSFLETFCKEMTGISLKI